MAEILVLGAGLNGLTVATMLARDGYSVRVVERDPAEPPDDPEAAWDDWERRGVNQFRMLHLMLPRWRSLMEAELPEVVAEVEARGGLRINLIASQPHARTGGWRDGDESFETVTARRPVLEAALAAVAARTPGVRIDRGLAVTGLVTASEPTGDIPRVAGVLTEGGEALRADLVVDACGRRSPLPAWLEAIGCPRPVEEREDCGFVYYGRHFRSPDGQLPAFEGSVLTAYDSLSILTLPADNGTWGVGFVTSARDRELRALRDPDTWSRALEGYPVCAHWGEGEPLAPEVAVMAGIEDRHRSLVIDGRAVATGIVVVGDSWAATNPSLGRGSSLGLLHAQVLRDVLRDVDTADPEKLVRRFDERTRAEVEPLYRSTLAFDRHRRAEIEADIERRPYETDDPSWGMTKALTGGATRDPEVMRGFAAIGSLQATADEVLARPGMFERVIEVGADLAPYPLPGLDRERLLDVVSR
jgi:2-polyprenyl-6-methoxyphenol hydroxylase-like FAD-dependent oxidoreductase